ncbi:hypothetical protein VTK26DRAFT_835 [Humicola hyalothermophila]
MAGFLSDSDSQYGYDLTVSDEELLLSIVDNIAPVSPQTDKPISPPAVAATPTPARNGNAASFSSPVPFDPDLDPDASIAIDETVAAISDDDLSSDFSDFERNDPHSHGQRPVHDVARSSATKITDSRRLAPFVPRHQKHISSFVTKTKPRSLPSLLPGPDVSYPDPISDSRPLGSRKSRRRSFCKGHGAGYRFVGPSRRQSVAPPALPHLSDEAFLRVRLAGWVMV